MHRRFISTVAMLMAMTLSLTGCTSEASNVSEAKDKKMDTGFTAATAGNYDSADTAVVISTNQENSAVVFMNMETGRQYTLYYDGTTYVKDKHDGPMTISQIKPGDVVDVTFLKGKRRLASIKRSPQAWVYDGIENYDLGGPNKTASIGSNTYSLPDDVVVLSEGRRSEVMDVVKQDVVTISGIDHEIYSINVEKGHGYLRLKNDQALIGGWIEVGNSVIREITEDMLLVVPEGSYQVLLSNNGASCIKDVVIERNKEVVLDVSDLEVPENRTGRILFSVTPETAKVSIDGKTVDISKAIELPYGIHQVHLEAKGYDSLTKYIQVGSEFATISFVLEEEREEERRTVSGNTVDNYLPSEPVEPVQNQNNQNQNLNNQTSVSDNALGAKSGSRVYIDSPRNVEVYLDGNYIGLSPVSFGKTVGSHTITLRKSGFETRSYTIYLYNDGKDTTYSFSELEQETVSGNSLVKVNIEEPKDVKVYVNDELVGTSPLSFERKAGQYKLTLSKEGYETKSYTMDLKGDKQEVTYRLAALKEESGSEHEHNFIKVEEESIEPTCTEAGKIVSKCECGEIEEKEIPAKGHNFIKVEEESAEPTCTEAGKTVSKCECGEIEEKEISAKGHNYIKLEEESREATCTEAGKIVGKCECGEYEEKDIPATGHDFQGGKCTKCDAEEPEHQHNFVRIESESAKATCTKDGKIVSKCECEEYEVEIIPATGHNYDENGKCVNCDAEDPDYEGKKGEEVEGSDTSQDNNQPPADTTTTERIVQNSNSRRRR